MKKLKGFTLIELIIVIVIIGILAAVTVIGYTSQAAKARNNSAFVGLTEAVKGANVCIGSGDSLTAIAAAGTIQGVKICTGATAMTGVWPNMTSIGGGWKYVVFAAGKPSDTVSNNGAAIATTNKVTANSIDISAGIPTGGTTVPTMQAADLGVACLTSGCTKYNF